MLKLKKYSKIIPIILIVSILFTACDVPDISKFTETSAEMTRGIRTSVKETENVLKTLVEKKDLFNADSQGKLDSNLKNYRTAMKPTLKALDSLDSYLDALNALAEANKKSEENSKAVVTSVSNLVTAISGLQIAETGINIVTGLVTLGEQFRTAKDFKKRVNIAADIVEGRYQEKITYPIVDGKPRETKVQQKICTDDVSNKSKIEVISTEFAAGKKRIQDNPAYTANDKETLIKSLQDQAENEVYKLGCGVTDLLRFSLQDLKIINDVALAILRSNYLEKNSSIIGFQNGIVQNDSRIQIKLTRVLDYKNLISLFRDTYTVIVPPAPEMLTVRNTLDSIGIKDVQLKNSMKSFLTNCNTPTNNSPCGEMEKFLTVTDSEAEIKTKIHDKIDLNHWNYTVGEIEKILDAKAGDLFSQNQKYLEDLERIGPNYISVVNELKAIKDKQEQMNKLIETNQDALDAWREAHMNLRLSLNTKKPLSIARLASKVKEIWSIINPEK